MRKGFTLLELIVVLGLIIAIGAVVLANVTGRRTDNDIVTATQQAATVLREAQSDSMAQENESTWSVSFYNTTSTQPYYLLNYTTVSGGTITVTVNKYLLPATVAYQTSTLASGASTTISFAQISGAASVSTTIGFYMPNESSTFSSTISIASSGSVGY